VTEALRRYIDARMQRLQRYGLKLDEAQVVLGVEKYRHTAEVILSLNGTVIQGKESTNAMYASLDRVFDQMRRRIRKRKEILSDHKPRAAVRKTRGVAAGAVPLESVIRSVRIPVPRLTVPEAAERLPSSPSSIVMFLNRSTERVQILRRLDSGEIELLDPQPT
jgi:putative sigma-54 modulation protein